MLTETEFLDNYQLALKLRHQGDVANAREILFLLFDRGRHVGGCGAVRLTFVLGDLAELAGVGRRRRDAEAEQTLDRLRAYRDEREAAARAGEAAFVELQELVALNRVLGRGERSADLLRRLRQELEEGGGGDGGDGSDHGHTVSTLADLVRGEIAPDDPEELVQEIHHHRLRGRLARLTRTVHELLDTHPAAASSRGAPTDGARAAALAGDLEELAADCRRLAAQVHDPEAGTVGRVREELRGRVREEIAELARETWVLLGEPLRLQLDEATTDRDELRRQVEHLRELARRARRLSARHGLDGSGDRGAELERRVIEMAADVATAIAEQRVWEDFDLPEDSSRGELAEWLDKKVRHDGLLVYDVLLRLGDPRAERMADWLLAYRQDEQMYQSLLTTTRRTGHPEMERRLGEEASRLMAG